MRADHAWVDCADYHGVPGEEPGCYGADMCHADGCTAYLDRAGHPKPGAPTGRACGHSRYIDIVASAGVSWRFRLLLLMFGRLQVSSQICVGADGEPIHETTTFGVRAGRPAGGTRDHARGK